MIHHGLGIGIFFSEIGRSREMLHYGQSVQMMTHTKWNVWMTIIIMSLLGVLRYGLPNTRASEVTFEDTLFAIRRAPNCNKIKEGYMRHPCNEILWLPMWLFCFIQYLIIVDVFYGATFVPNHWKLRIIIYNAISLVWQSVVCHMLSSWFISS